MPLNISIVLRSCITLKLLTTTYISDYISKNQKTGISLSATKTDIGLIIVRNVLVA